MDSPTINQNHFALRKKQQELSTQNQISLKGLKLPSSICMRATLVVKTSMWYPIRGSNQCVGVVHRTPPPFSAGSHWSERRRCELQRSYRPWTWSSCWYVILQSFLDAAPLGSGQKEVGRKGARWGGAKETSGQQINFHWTLNISWKDSSSRRTDGLNKCPAATSSHTQTSDSTWSQINRECGKTPRKTEPKKFLNHDSKVISVRQRGKINSFRKKKNNMVTVCYAWQEHFREKMLRRHSHGHFTQRAGLGDRVWIMFLVQANMWSMWGCDTDSALVLQVNTDYMLKKCLLCRENIFHFICIFLKKEMDLQDFFFFKLPP